jgi:hypothetical protein
MSTLYVDTITEKTAGNGVQIPGHVVQVVEATGLSASTISTTSTSFVDATGYSITITPTSTTSKILLLAQVNMQQDGGTSVNARGYVGWFLSNNTELYRNFIGSYDSNATNHNIYQSVNMQVIHSPATTSATTYKIRIATDISNNICKIMGGNGNNQNSLIAMEIAQ